MGPINVVVQDANNLVLEVTPTAETSVILDRGVVGPTGLVWKGNWSSTTLYIPNDAVFNPTNSASYICIVENTNQQPPNASYWDLLVAGFAGGDVNGPASATDNAIARFDGTTGKLIQNSGVTISDAGIVNIAALTASKPVFTDASDNLTSSGTLGIDQGGTGATTLAGASIVTYTGIQTLTNKTISADNNTLSGIAASSFVLSNASGNIDGAAAQKAIPTGVVVGTTDTQTLTNKTVVAPVVLASTTITQDGVIVTGRAGGSTSLRVTVAPTTLTASRAQTLPDAAGTFVLDTATQTLTNKTLTSPVIGTITNTGTLTLPTSTDTLVGRATTDTLTNKTLTAPTITGAILNDGYTEEVLAITGTTPALTPTTASIQTWTLTANSTPTAGTWASGQSLLLMIDDGTGFTVTWTSLAVTWLTGGNAAPILATTGYTAIVLWKVGTTIYGATVGG